MLPDKIALMQKLVFGRNDIEECFAISTRRQKREAGAREVGGKLIS